VHIYDSNEELQFSYWLDELKEKGYIINWKYNKEEIELIDKKKIDILINNKKKNIHLLNKLTYTYDFSIEWDVQSKCLLYNNISENCKDRKFFLCLQDDISYIDVKGTFAGKHNNSAVSFPIKQKLLYEKENKYVQKVIPIKLFEQTFVPSNLLNRKYKFNIKTSKEFLNE